MLDHLLGKPSANLKRAQVWLLLLLAGYLLRQPQPPTVTLRRINRYLTKYAPWKLVVAGSGLVYFFRNVLLLLGLNATEPYVRQYSRNFYRATWVNTALDAGFFTAMPLRPKPLRDFASIVFGLFYLVFSGAAEEKVKRTRASITVLQLRCAWEKMLNPYIRLVGRRFRPVLPVMRYVHVETRPGHRIRPNTPLYLLYAGAETQLGSVRRIVLNFPGGGFVAMNPKCHEDYLRRWARQLGTDTLVVSVDYAKAPEHPYPWALNECWEVYRTIIATRGRCVGLSGESMPRIILAGDSAGGNLVVGVAYRCLEYRSEHPLEDMPVPTAMLLAYPSLDFTITSWMTESSAKLIRQESKARLTGALWDVKDHTRQRSQPLDSFTPSRHHAGMAIVEEMDDDEPAAPEETKLLMTSWTSYYNDRMISVDLIRAMAILYIGKHRADFVNDYYLSSLVAPDSLLAQLPPIYMLCGEKDPLVDDTIVFAGRVRAARKRRRMQTMNRYGFASEADDAVEVEVEEDGEYARDNVTVWILAGASHAILQMMSLLPEAVTAVDCCAGWMGEAFDTAEGYKRSRSDVGVETWEDARLRLREGLVREQDLMSRRRTEVAAAIR